MTAYIYISEPTGAIKSASPLPKSPILRLKTNNKGRNGHRTQEPEIPRVALNNLLMVVFCRFDSYYIRLEYMTTNKLNKYRVYERFSHRVRGLVDYNLKYSFVGFTRKRETGLKARYQRRRSLLIRERSLYNDTCCGRFSITI